MTIMKYKGYAGLAEVDTDAGAIRGRVANLLDVITFEGETVKEAEQAFRDSVDDYLAFCAKLGRAPERPYSGTLNARLGAELHRKLAILAAADGVSINEKLRQITENAVNVRLRTASAAKGTAKDRKIATRRGGGPNIGRIVRAKATQKGREADRKKG